MKERVLPLLIEARRILATPNNWTKHAEAKFSPLSRSKLEVDHANANCFCLTGALRKAGLNIYNDQIGGVEEAEDALYTFTRMNIPTFNDHRLTHFKHIVEVLDLTIEELQNDSTKAI